MSELIDKEDYHKWFNAVKSQIQNRQVKVAITANSALISFYWDLGKTIVKKQDEANWGNSVVDRLANDLNNEFPDVSGFSRTNLFSIRQFYLFYRTLDEKVPQAWEDKRY